MSKRIRCAGWLLVTALVGCSLDLSIPDPSILDRGVVGDGPADPGQDLRLSDAPTGDSPRPGLVTVVRQTACPPDFPRLLGGGGKCPSGALMATTADGDQWKVQCTSGELAEFIQIVCGKEGLPDTTLAIAPSDEDVTCGSGAVITVGCSCPSDEPIFELAPQTAAHWKCSCETTPTLIFGECMTAVVLEPPVSSAVTLGEHTQMALCSGGGQVISGGCGGGKSEAVKAPLVASYPKTNGTGWVCTWKVSDEGLLLTAHAVCWSPL